MSSSKRLLKNTVFLYLRQFITMLVGLYTVRIVLRELGTEDYGIYNVVGGVVSSLGFLSGTMAISTQRYLSFALGAKDESCKVDKVFKVTLLIYLFLILVVFLIAETLGLWFINNHLVFPEIRSFAVNIIYQTSIFSFMLSLFSSPFMASIIAHEDMGVFAYISIVEVLLKLLCVLLLQGILFDKLIVYSSLLFCSSLITTSLYMHYTYRKYAECKFSLIWDKKLFREMMGYSVWNLFGNVAWILKNQGTSILLNMLYGPIMNAAHAVSLQVRGIASNFAQNFSVALNPQIIKSYAAKEYDSMFVLLYRGSKVTYFLMMLIVLPLYFHLDKLLLLWLGEVAPHTVTFTKLMLVEILIESMSLPMASANQATGKIRSYQSWIGFWGILNLPVSYLFVKLGFFPEVVFIISIILQTAIVLVRIIYLNRIKSIVLKDFLAQLLCPIIFVTIASYICCSFVTFNDDGLINVILDLAVCLLICVVFVFFLGINIQERNVLLNMIKRKLHYDQN